MSAIPAFLLKALIELAVQFGLPFLLTKIPWLPASVITIIKDLLKQIEGSVTPKEVALAKMVAKHEIDRNVHDAKFGNGGVSSK